MENEAIQLTKHWDAVAGASETSIADTQQLIGFELPDDLLEFMRHRNGGSGYVSPSAGENGGAWLTIKPIEEWPGLTDDYEFAARKLVMIGTEGGTFAYCISLKSLPMHYREVDFGETGQGRYLGSSLAEFLVTLRDDLKPKAPKAAGAKTKPKVVPGPPKDKPFRELKGADGPIHAIAISPMGDRLLASQTRLPDLVFDLKTGKSVASAPPPPESLMLQPVGWIGNRPVGILMKFDAENRQPNSKPQTFNVIDIVTGDVISEFFEKFGWSNSTAGAFSPDGSKLAFTAPHSDELYLDVLTGKRIAHLPTASNRPFAIAWHPDGSKFAMGRTRYTGPHDWDHAAHGNRGPEQPDWAVLIVDTAANELGRIKVELKGNEFQMAQAKDSPGIFGVQFSSDGKQILVVRYGDVRIFQMNGGSVVAEPIATIKVPLRTIHAACFVAGNRLAVTTHQGLILLYDLKTLKPIRQWWTSKLQLRVLAASPDGKFLFTANGTEPYSASQAESKTVRVWKIDV